MKTLTGKKGYGSQVLFASLLMAAAGCGGGGASNDQGASVSLISYNYIDNVGVCLPNVASSGITVALTNGDSAEGPVSGAFSCLTVRNNLTTQGVRVERLKLEYYIEGASEQPPATTQAWGKVLGSTAPNGIGITGGEGGGGAAGGTGGTAGGTGGTAGGGTGAIFGPGAAPGSDLPPAWSSIPQQITGAFMAVPPEIGEWLAFHRNSLPEPPFHMTLVTTAMGSTTAGDEIETNALPYVIVVEEDRVIKPNSGTPSRPSPDVTPSAQAGGQTSSNSGSNTGGFSDSSQGGAATL